VTPGAAFAPVRIVIGLMLIGGVFFVGMLLFNRKSLDAEPRGVVVSMHRRRLHRRILPIDEQPLLAIRTQAT
jgi:Flp pilus assembly protein protease CpaA